VSVFEAFNRRGPPWPVGQVVGSALDDYLRAGAECVGRLRSCRHNWRPALGTALLLDAKERPGDLSQIASRFAGPVSAR